MAPEATVPTSFWGGGGGSPRRTQEAPSRVPWGLGLSGHLGPCLPNAIVSSALAGLGGRGRGPLSEGPVLSWYLPLPSDLRLHLELGLGTLKALQNPRSSDHRGTFLSPKEKPVPLATGIAGRTPNPPT